MPLTIVRLRMWLAAAAIVVAVTVAAVYFYGRWRAYRAVRDVPRQLGLNIQQSTEGFSLSKSEGGRTIFTVRAAKAVQYREGGRAELRDVEILVYGRRANRFDQIYGEHFEYDPQSGNVTALGEVHIDLEGTAEGQASADRVPPTELSNPIHLKTSGLVFNQRSGVAETSERIEFRVPQATGSARGATYDSRAATLSLHADIEVRATGPRPANIVAQRGMITRGPNQAVLESVRVERADSSLRAEKVTVLLRDDNTVEHLVAVGDVQVAGGGEARTIARAPRADAWITEENMLRSALLSGGVSFESSGQGRLSGSAGKVEMTFRGASVLDSAVASENVRLLQPPAAASATQANEVELTSQGVTFDIRHGRVHRAVTSGPAQVATRPVQAAQASVTGPTVATAGRFTAEFDRNGRLQHVLGSPNAKVVSSTRGQPDRISTSNRLEVRFNLAGGIASLLQAGNFEYREGSDGAAFAREARYEPAGDALLLLGSPRVVQSGITTTAERIRIRRGAGEAVAEGEVKTTYSELQQQPDGALLAASEPIHVTAARMTATQAGGMATYAGGPRTGARLWQGANVVQAPVIEFNRDRRTLVAHSVSGAAAARSGNSAPAISTVFVLRDQSGKVTPVNISAARLSYVDAERRARLEGGVVVKGAEATVTAEQVDILLQPRGQTSASSKTGTAGPSQIERIVATGGVVVKDSTRQATGQKLVYTAENAMFVLTGGTPSIFDAEHGKITGDSLTFFSRNDRVLVEGGASPTVTRTRVAN